MADLLSPQNAKKCGSWFLSRWGIATIAAFVTISVLVYLGHLPHLITAALYLMVLACPLHHLFMHGDHHNHNKEGAAQDADKTQDGGKNEKHGEGCH